MSGIASKGGKKNRKHKRNQPYCQRRLQISTGLKNKIKRIKRHLRRLPEDRQAQRLLAEIA